MSDNPILTENQLESAEKQFTGVFHDRYIKGLWVSAEGIIYKQFADNPKSFIINTPFDDIMYCNIGFDFGGNGSAHAGICTGFSKGLQKIVILEEYYRKEVLTPVQLYEDIINFIRKCQSKFNVYDIYFDSAETTLIRGIKTELEKNKIPINPHNARKSEILGRIRFTNQIMAQNRFFIIKHCNNIIQALQSVVWDSKKLNDIRLDDGNFNIDSLDAFEYSIEPLMNDIIEIGGLNS